MKKIFVLALFIALTACSSPTVQESPYKGALPLIEEKLQVDASIEPESILAYEWNLERDAVYLVSGTGIRDCALGLYELDSGVYSPVEIPPMNCNSNSSGGPFLYLLADGALLFDPAWISSGESSANKVFLLRGTQVEAVYEYPFPGENCDELYTQAGSHQRLFVEDHLLNGQVLTDFYYDFLETGGVKLFLTQEHCPELSYEPGGVWERVQNPDFTFSEEHVDIEGRTFLRTVYIDESSSTFLVDSLDPSGRLAQFFETELPQEGFLTLFLQTQDGATYGRTRAISEDEKFSVELPASLFLQSSTGEPFLLINRELFRYTLQ
ncbi:hypothetical protein IPG41_03505 [Candidatus Peregrinibacteria bacterium]|nr:MAG: hypothetical protein IPG41_03505 [Candidatus Peregrinibacteria bacterium]